MLSASKFSVIIVCFTKEDVTVLLFNASIAAWESENILIYCMLLCLVSMNFLHASFIAMISAWNTAVCMGNRIIITRSARYSSAQ